MGYEKALKTIGFEEKEVEIYLFLLKKGPVSQQVISDETRILRQTVYDLSNKMEIKGYISSTIIGRRKVYSAVSPELLLKQIKEKEEEFTQIIPELNKLKQETCNVYSESFIGMSGLKNLINMTLDSQTDILWIANKSINDNVLQGYYWHNYAKKREENKIPIKLLIEPTNKKDWDTDIKSKRETRRSNIVKGMDSSFIMFDDNVIMYSLVGGDLFGILIKDKSIKESLEKMFYSFWKNGK